MTEETTLTVGFEIKLTVDGDVERVQLYKDGVVIGLTKEQASALGRELLERFPRA